jgi:hypothetical protein
MRFASSFDEGSTPAGRFRPRSARTSAPYSRYLCRSPCPHYTLSSAHSRRGYPPSAETLASLSPRRLRSFRRAKGSATATSNTTEPPRRPPQHSATEDNPSPKTNDPPQRRRGHWRARLRALAPSGLARLPSNRIRRTPNTSGALLLLAELKPRNARKISRASRQSAVSDRVPSMDWKGYPGK